MSITVEANIVAARAAPISLANHSIDWNCFAIETIEQFGRRLRHVASNAQVSAKVAGLSKKNGPEMQYNPTTALNLLSPHFAVTLIIGKLPWSDHFRLHPSDHCGFCATISAKSS